MTTKWMGSRGDRCEWDPGNSRPARGHWHIEHGWTDYTGCPNEAELIVGANGMWRLVLHAQRRRGAR